jgi:pimeloyl-ACP methyl ester carboxylesterase
MRVLYLHGFASSARSSKAVFFARKFAERGVKLETPDLNEPDFSTLTVSRMVAQVVAAIEVAAGPVTLIGSSLGAFVAVQAALTRAGRVERLVLLAPALDFGGNRMRQLGGVGLEHWKASNTLDVFHYGYGRVVPVHYELYSDARRHDCVDAVLPLPVQVFQGRHDTAVDADSVQQWAAARPNVELHLLDDDHQLLASLEYIWAQMARFLLLDASTSRSPDTAPESPNDRS